ncbi:MAG: SWIM zinc finger family protein [Bacillota bacterium]
MKLDRDFLQGISTEKSWNRGLNYYQSGRVLEAKIEGNTFKAEVMGNSYPYYQVEIDTKPPIQASCSCPYDFEGVCKHIIAAGLTWIDKRDSLSRSSEVKKPEIEVELEELTEKLGRDDFLQLLTKLVYEKHWVMKFILDYVEEIGKAPANAVLKKLDLLQEEALAVIREFNSYGGGPRHEEDLFYENTFEIVDILEDQEIPADYRQDLIENFMSEYIKKNSVLNDMALELAYTAANSKEDWLIVLDYLKKANNRYDQENIMKIYQEKLGDKEKYLELRKKNLEYGADYYDLVCFYENEGEIEKAVETALKGEKQGHGRIIDNLRFLRKYYQQEGNYQKAIQYYLKEFSKDPSSSAYFAILDFCQEEDKDEIEIKLNELIKDAGYGKYYILASIYEEKKEYEKIMELAMQDKIDPREWEETLILEYPGEMIEYYKKQVQKSINKKRRKSYRKGAQIALKIKEIFTEVLGEAEKWEKYYQGILECYPNHPALQDEFKKACDPRY